MSNYFIVDLGEPTPQQQEAIKQWAQPKLRANASADSVQVFQSKAFIQTSKTRNNLKGKMHDLIKLLGLVNAKLSNAMPLTMSPLRLMSTTTEGLLAMMVFVCKVGT